MMFSPKSPLFKVLMMSLEAMSCLSVTLCYELKHVDSQKAYGFGGLADGTTDKMNWWLCREDGPFSKC